MSISSLNIPPRHRGSIIPPQARKKENLLSSPPVSVRFGGLNDLLAKAMQPITEQFIWGFTFQDVMILWPSRILSSLRRGRDAYDIQKDPVMRTKPPLKQLAYSTYRNLKGLNYSNATEETLREVETGPGLLVAQSIIYGVAMVLMAGKAAMLMGYDQLKAYRGAFLKSLEQTPVLGQTAGFLSNKMTSSQLVEHFMENLLHPEFQYQTTGQRLIDLSKLTHQTDKPLKELLGKMYPKATQVKYADAVKAWIKQWVSLKHNGRFIDKQHQHRSEELEHAFKRILYWFKEQVYKTPNPRSLHMVKVSLAKDPITVDSMLHNIEKFKPYLEETLKSAKKTTPGASGASLKTALVNQSQRLLKKITINKFLLGGIATALAAGTVILVSALAQKGRAYPANRKLQLGELQGHQGHGHGPHFQGTSYLQQQNSLLSRQVRQPGQSAADVLFGLLKQGPGGAA
jgi:hypothetical protein